MSDVFFREMQIPRPHYNLNIGSGNHGKQTGHMMESIEKLILQDKPTGVLVYGDTNSTLAGALAAAKLHVPVIHVEAGLRSFNKKMPEEINRIACDHVSTLLFSPTQTGIKNLEGEGITHHDGITHHEGPALSSDHPGVYHCGDVMYDNTLFFRDLSSESSAILKDLDLKDKAYILATIHRPSNTDHPGNLENILQAMDRVSREKTMDIVLPLHPRTASLLKGGEYGNCIKLIRNNASIRLIPSVSFMDMISLEAKAKVILTDSGGVQKEAWFMEKPVVVLRNETEWVEIIEAGNGALCGADTEKIHKATLSYLDAPPLSYPPIFGDGKAADQILEILLSANWY
jgi:UDP-GlcNAc3NAcA epimerase